VRDVRHGVAAVAARLGVDVDGGQSLAGRLERRVDVHRALQPSVPGAPIKRPAVATSAMPEKEVNTPLSAWGNVSAYSLAL